MTITTTFPLSSVFLVLVCLVEIIIAVGTIDVYREFYMKRGDLPATGSSASSVNLLSTTTQRYGSLSRMIVIEEVEKVTVDWLEKEVRDRGAEGLLILLPELSSSDPLSPTFFSKWKEVEKHLYSTEYKFPIYFAFKNEYTEKIYSDIQEISIKGELPAIFGSGDNYQLVVSAAEPSPLKDITAQNIQTWLPGAGSATPEGNALPTIAVVAYYDTFAVAPGLAAGADSSASGVVAVLELTRLFSKLYENAKTHAKYNLLFLLTSGGRLNYAGTKQWLGNADARLLDSVEFVLCLDTIANGDELYLHVSKVPKEGPASKLYESFNKTSKHMDIGLKTVHKKINISSADIDWEHEQFSRKKTLAATLSHLSEPVPLFSRSDIFDVRSRTNVSNLIRNIKFVGESIAKHVYGFYGKELEIFNGSLAVNEQFVESWLNALTSTSRATPYIPKDSNVLSGLERVLKEYSTQVNVQNIQLESDVTFYDTMVTTMSSYKVKPVTFDIMITGLVILYLTVLYAVIKGPTEFFQQIVKIFSKSDKKKKK